MTRFRVGDSGSISGVEWRIVQGRKSTTDLRLEVRAVRWVPVKMTVGFLFSDFYAANEETLAREGYLSRSVAGRAGERYLNFLRGAQLLGWQAAAEQLEEEREQAAQRRNAA